MDANYVINRLKSTPYKFPTAEVLRQRLHNLSDPERAQILNSLKAELWKEKNIDIHEPLHDMMLRTRRAA
ncbi:MAG: hypothetical protein EOO51_05385 [Flavobacterium sp.]|nr:MAG: hypothetical protein EOO51_05385 [Flavobacterium sp.]